MRRYAITNYKPHYACFNCCKTFKRRLLSDIEGKRDFELKEARWPECHQLMANMGKDFEAPKKEDKKEWDHLRLLYSVGITFHSCGCTGPGYIPNTSENLIIYFQELKHEFECNLNFWRQRQEPSNEKEIQRDMSKNWQFISKIPYELKPKKGVISNGEAKKYWITKIKEIEDKLAQAQVANGNKILLKRGLNKQY